MAYETPGAAEFLHPAASPADGQQIKRTHISPNTS